MLKVLNQVHPDKSSMLGADSFAVKARKIEKSDLRKKKLSKRQSGMYNDEEGGS